MTATNNEMNGQRRISLFIIRGIHYSWHSVVLLLALACNPNSTRPPQLAPVTGAVRVDVALPRDLATQELADQLVVDTFPVTVVQIQDG